jgi:hypothetical protein
MNLLADEIPGMAASACLRATARVLPGQLEHITDQLGDLRRLAGAVAHHVERGDAVLVQPRPTLRCVGDVSSRPALVRESCHTVDAGR